MPNPWGLFSSQKDIDQVVYYSNMQEKYTRTDTDGHGRTCISTQKYSNFEQIFQEMGFGGPLSISHSL